MPSSSLNPKIAFPLIINVEKTLDPSDCIYSGEDTSILTPLRFHSLVVFCGKPPMIPPARVIASCPLSISSMFTRLISLSGEIFAGTEH